MIRLLSLPDQTRYAQLAAEQIDPVESSALRIESEDRKSRLISSVERLGEHPMSNEDQPSTTVRCSNRRRTLHEVDAEVATLVLNPAEVHRTEEVARLARSSRGHDGVRSAEVKHPLTAKLDCFTLRTTQWVRPRRLSLHKTSLPEAAVLATCEVRPEEQTSAHARDLTPPTSSRCNAKIGDRS